MKWIIEEEAVGMLIRSFLIVKGQFSKRLLIKAKSENGKILVNNEKKTVRYVLQEGDVLEVILPPEHPSTRMMSEKMHLDIVYEDAHILVINKPAGVATIPSRHHPSGTIANGLLYYYEIMKLEATVHVVTRLDRDTSGLMIIAKSQHCHSLLSKMQREHELERKYTAIVEGKLNATKGTINQPIGRKADSIIERVVTEDGQPAITHFSVVKKYEKMTLLDIALATGRTHQIRVHLAFTGHPLVGDQLYGGAVSSIMRQALHCSKLLFTHPFSGEKLQVKASLPRDMEQLIMKY